MVIWWGGRGCNGSGKKCGIWGMRLEMWDWEAYDESG